MLQVPVAVVNHSLESESMGVIRLNSYVLIVRGSDRLKFIDGLSTNKIEGDCSTVFTTTTAKVIDMVDVIDMGEFLALVGHSPFKNDVLGHMHKRILSQDIQIGDASENNSVYLSTTDINVTDSVTKRNTWRGWILVAPNSEKINETMDLQDFNEYRVMNMIPHLQSTLVDSFIQTFIDRIVKVAHPFLCQFHTVCFQIFIDMSTTV